LEKHSYSHQLSMGTPLFVHRAQPEGQKQAVQQSQSSFSHPLFLRLLPFPFRILLSVFFRCKIPRHITHIQGNVIFPAF